MQSSIPTAVLHRAIAPLAVGPDTWQLQLPAACTGQALSIICLLYTSDAADE